MAASKQMQQRKSLQRRVESSNGIAHIQNEIHSAWRSRTGSEEKPGKKLPQESRKKNDKKTKPT